jgi:transposase
VRAELAVRDVLVRTRTRYIALAKALIRRDGHRIPGSDAEHAADHMLALAPEPTLRAELAPLVAMWHTLGEQIRAADRRLATVVAADPIVRRLATVPGIGPVTATAYVATIDEVQRFPTAHHVEAYLGLVPSERSSGEKQQRGHITKAGNVRLRWLLVEAGWRMLLSRRAETVHLRTWALRIALRRGKKIAVVALARRLAGILYAMWRDGTDYAGPPPKQTRAPEE